MNKTLKIVLLSITCGLSATMSPTLAEPIGPKPEELVTVQGFQLMVSTKAQAFSSGSPILLDTLTKNVTNKKLSLVASSRLGSSDYEIEVKNEKGESMPLTRYGQRVERNKGTFFSVGGVDVLPGANYGQEILVNQPYDMTDPGVYLVKVKRDVPAPGNIAATKVTSNTLRITVGFATLKRTDPW